jgi:hypothetical protein
MARITWKQFKAENGLETPEAVTEFLESAVFDGECPALCDEGCIVEPDGRCEHEAPSALLALGLI